MARKKLLNIIAYVVLIILLIVTVFPLLYVVLASFKTNQEILTSGANIFPTKFHFENYADAWKLADFGRGTWNSIYMTVLIVLGVIVTSTITGYVFARGNFRGKKFWYICFMSTMFVSMGSLMLYPLLDVTKFLHLNNSLWGVIVIQIFGLNVTNIFLVQGHIESIPKEIDEAAKIDGCGFFRIYTNIIFPLLKPIVATVGLITFRSAWNEYLMPLVFTLGDPQKAPLVVQVVSLRSGGEAASSWNLMLAGTTISIIPMLIAFIFLNRYFVSGLTTGAVKG